MAVQVVHVREVQAAPRIDHFAGLDLGQAHDFTAMAIIERSEPSRGLYAYDCRHLQRWQLRTPYPAIVAETAKIMNSPLMSSPTLAVDATGVGAPVIDLLKEERMPNVYLMPVQITGGADENYDGGTYRVPKRNLVSSLQVALQQGQLKVASSLPEAATLAREMQNFQVKINEHANDSYGAWREGTHDDLVLAVALALWAATRQKGSGIWI